MAQSILCTQSPHETAKESARAQFTLFTDGSFISSDTPCWLLPWRTATPPWYTL